MQLQAEGSKLSMLQSLGFEVWVVNMERVEVKCYEMLLKPGLIKNRIPNASFNVVPLPPQSWLMNCPRLEFSKLKLRMGPHIVRNEGPLGLFKGVDASAARQLVYSGVAWLIFGASAVFRSAPGGGLRSDSVCTTCSRSAGSIEG